MISRDVSFGLFWAPHLTIPNLLPFRGLRQVPCYIESEALYLLKLVMVSYEMQVGGSLLPASTLLLILNPEVPNTFLRISEKSSVGFQTWLKPLIACQQLYILGPNISLIFCPIHVVTFTLISNLATDYIQKRRGEPGLFSFEYNLSLKFDIKVKVTTWIGQKTQLQQGC